MISLDASKTICNVSAEASTETVTGSAASEPQAIHGSAELIVCNYREYEGIYGSVIETLNSNVPIVEGNWKMINA